MKTKAEIEQEIANLTDDITLLRSELSCGRQHATTQPMLAQSVAKRKALY